MRNSKAVSRYLSKYALPEASIATHLRRSYEHAVVIPVCREPDLGACLATLQATERQALIICVVNARKDASNETRDANSTTLIDLGCADRPWALRSLSTTADLLVIDRSSTGRELGDKQGVGTARRIGADIALTLWHQGQLRSHWIHSTDADARVPPDYFAAPEQVVARVIPFAHQTRRPALMLYEIGLRLYNLGLRFARSPYAFHTLGSALAFRCDAYAMVGGVPQRQAGEDFYLLNKLAKVGKVRRSAQRPLQLIDRDSDRVPFGTGPGARLVQRQLVTGQGYSTYDPRTFDALRVWLRSLRELASHRDIDHVRSTIQAHDPEVWRCLRDMGAPQALDEALKNTVHAADLDARLMRWFDAFRTLRFIHQLRDRRWPLVPVREALHTAGTRHDFSVKELDLPEICAALLRVDQQGAGQTVGV